MRYATQHLLRAIPKREAQAQHAESHRVTYPRDVSAREQVRPGA